MCSEAFPVQEKLGLIIHAFKVKINPFLLMFSTNRESLFIEPGALRYPFDEQAVAVNIGIRDFSRLPQVVVRATGNRACPPVTLVAAIRKVRASPTPVFTVKIFDEPVAAIEIDTTTHLATPAGLFL